MNGRPGCPRGIRESCEGCDRQWVAEDPLGASWRLGGRPGPSARTERGAHFKSRAGETGLRADSSLDFVLKCHPKCHVLPEAASEAPIRTGCGGFQSVGTPAKW